MKLRFVVCLAMMFTLLGAAQAVVYRPGLIQAKFNTEKDYATPIVTATGAERVPGTVMGDIQANESTYATQTYSNTVTGTKYAWNQKYTTFGYTGQMYAQAGTTYTFGKYFDDGTRIIVGGSQIMDHPTCNEFKTGNFVTNAPGWYDIEIRIYDGSGGKGPSGSTWGNDLGLGCNTNGLATMAPKDGWTRLLDPGDMSWFRTATDENFMSQGAVSAQSDDLVASMTFNVPTNAVLSVLYGDDNAGVENLQAWDHQAVLQTIVPGNVTSNITVSGLNLASKPYVCFYLRSVETNSMSAVFEAFTMPFQASANPEATLSVGTVDYTNATFSATAGSMGLGGTSVNLSVEIASDANFSSILDTIAVTNGILNVPCTVSGISNAVALVTNTTYYARAKLVNQNSAVGYSPTIPFTTLNPTPATVSAVLVGSTWDTATIRWTLSDYGADSSTAKVYYDVSTDAAFSPGETVSIETASVSGTLSQSANAVMSGLTGASSYFARARVVNTWGLTSVSSTIAFGTATQPFAAVGLSASDDANGVRASASLLWVGDATTVSAKLFVNDVEMAAFENVTMAAPEIAGVSALAVGQSATLRITFTAVHGGETFTQSFTATVTRGGASSYAVADPAAVNRMVLMEGDTVSLPVLPGVVYAVSGDGVGLQSDDGLSFQAVGTGMTCLEVRDSYAGTTTRHTFYVTPRPAGDGDVFYVEMTSHQDWATAPWTKITDRSTRTYPNASDDYAVVDFPAQWQALKLPNANEITVGGVLMRNMGNWNTLRGNEQTNSVLRLSRTDGKRPFLLIDSPTGGGQFSLGCGNGASNGIHKRLTVHADGDGWDLILGAYHTFNAKYFYNLNNNIPIYLEGLRMLIPEGQTVRFIYASEWWWARNLARYWLGTEYGAYSETTFKRFTTEPCGMDIVGKGVLELCTGRHDFFYAMPTLSFEGTIRMTPHKRFYETIGSAFVLAPNVAYELVGSVSKADTLWDSYQTSASTNRSTQFTATADVKQTYLDLWGEPENFLSCRYFRLYGAWLQIPRNDANLGVRDPFVTRFDDFRLRGQGYITKLANYDSTRTYYRDLEITKFTRETGHDTLYVNGANVNNRIDHNRYGHYIIPDLADSLVGAAGDVADASGVHPIVPWMVLGENDNGGNGASPVDGDMNWVMQLRFAAVTNNGMVARSAHAGSIASAAAAANVVVWNETLSASKTINSLVAENLAVGTNTLTISSGAFAMARGLSDSRIGDSANVNSGTIVLGDETHPAYLFAAGVKALNGGQQVIWTKLVAPGGLTKALYGQVFIYGDQTGIMNDLHVNGGNFWLGYPAIGAYGNGAWDYGSYGNAPNTYPVGCTMTSVTNFTVHGGGVLGLARDRTRLFGENNVLAETLHPVISRQAIVTLEDAGEAPARVALGTNYEATAPGEFVCRNLFVNGEMRERGTWGASDSGADFVDDVHFAGPGVLTVRYDNNAPATVILVR